MTPTVIDHSITCDWHPVDPIFLNPNSFHSITDVLQHLSEIVSTHDLATGNKREWIPVCCDGLPYKMVVDIVEKTRRCQVCQEYVYDLDAFLAHSDHADEGKADFPFDWVVPIIGLGHVEMNLYRSFLETTWDFFMKSIVKKLGFNSDNALEYARKGKDHHKTHQILLSVYIGGLMELVVPYVTSCAKAEKRDPTYAGFMCYCEKVKNENVKIFKSFLCGFLHKLMLLRQGVRKNNATAIEAAFLEGGLLFFGANHPRYQEIYYRLSCDIVRQPAQLRQFIRNVQCVSSTNNTGHSQGADFLFEKVNKETKSWVSYGIPSNGQWVQIIRNMKDWASARRRLHSVSQNSDVQHRDNRFTELRDEINTVRLCIRQSNFLTDPMTEKKLTGLDGLLDDNVKYRDFNEWCTEEKRKYFSKQESTRFPLQQADQQTSSLKRSKKNPKRKRV